MQKKTWKHIETTCAAKLRPAIGVCDASKARAPRFGPAASSSWCDWNFGIIHNICSSMRLNWPKWGFKPWVFWYTMIIQTNPYFQILPSTKRVLLSLSGQWWRHHPKHGDESIGWASNHQTHQPLMDRVDKEQGSFVALSLLFWWNPILPRTDIIKQHVTR